MKKPWEKPNLVVLIRSRPEESVLDHCKLGFSGAGPAVHVAGCHEENCIGTDNNGTCNSWECIGTCSGQADS